MTAEHFTEFVDTIKKTYGFTNDIVADIFGVTPWTLMHWKRKGVAKRTSIRFVPALQTYLVNLGL